jgi:hypothetical protein
MAHGRRLANIDAGPSGIFSGPTGHEPIAFVVLVLCVGLVLVIAAIAAQELPSAGRALKDIATEVVQATGEHSAVAAPLTGAGPPPTPELLAAPAQRARDAGMVFDGRPRQNLP